MLIVRPNHAKIRHAIHQEKHQNDEDQKCADPERFQHVMEREVDERLLLVKRLDPNSRVRRPERLFDLLRLFQNRRGKPARVGVQLLFDRQNDRVAGID